MSPKSLLQFRQRFWSTKLDSSAIDVQGDEFTGPLPAWTQNATELALVKALHDLGDDDAESFGRRLGVTRKPAPACATVVSGEV